MVLMSISASLDIQQTWQIFHATVIDDSSWKGLALHIQMKELQRDFDAVVVLAGQGEGVLSTEVQVEFLVQMKPWEEYLVMLIIVLHRGEKSLG